MRFWFLCVCCVVFCLFVVFHFVHVSFMFHEFHFICCLKFLFELILKIVVLGHICFKIALPFCHAFVTFPSSSELNCFPKYDEPIDKHQPLSPLMLVVVALLCGGGLPCVERRYGKKRGGRERRGEGLWGGAAFWVALLSQSPSVVFSTSSISGVVQYRLTNKIIGWPALSLWVVEVFPIWGGAIGAA